MVVTEQQGDASEEESEEMGSAPRISAWTGAPVVDTPWLSKKTEASQIRTAKNRLSQQDNSRRSRSVLPRLKNTQPEVDQLIRQLSGPVKAEWRQFVEQAGTLTAGQQQKLEQTVYAQKKSPIAPRNLNESTNQLNERKIIKLIQQLDKYATLHKLYHEVKVPTPMIDMKSTKIVHKQVDQVTPTLQLSNELDLIFDGDIESDSNTLNAYHAYQKIRKQRYKV